MTEASGRTGTTSPARDRLLSSAYVLFSRHGTRAVGIDTIIEHAGVAKKTLYTHFASKEVLVLAFLGERERVWTRGWLQEQVLARAQSPADRLLTIFDVFGDWFARPDFEGCSFISVMLEHPEETSAVRRASVEHLATIRCFLSELVSRAGVTGEDDVDDLARQWHILMKGAIVAAGEGDVHAAARSRRIGVLLLARHGIDVGGSPGPAGPGGSRGSAPSRQAQAVARRGR